MNGQNPERKTSSEPEIVDLCHCDKCKSDLVYPVEWYEVESAKDEDGCWEVTLCCPNCENSRVGIFNQPSVDQFDKRLDDGKEVLKSDLGRLAYSNMQAEINAFVYALDRDFILPEDF